ncbi:MAG: hypothetical protein CM1200mP18_21880 [Gammaproteobacteria bacterium]|nr:MAG: hypothetical protein CM1200mP18_21880 [Gammaproteobacteria bacterium]
MPPEALTMYDKHDINGTELRRLQEIFCFQLALMNLPNDSRWVTLISHDRVHSRFRRGAGR